MRVYLAATMPILARAGAEGQLALASVIAHGVTPSLREWYAESDLEELEHEAFLAAADSSLQLLSLDPQAVRRRIVLSADVDEAADAHDEQRRSLVTLAGSVAVSTLASIHIDDAAAVDDIAAACAALVAGATQDDDAVDAAMVHDLLWFDRSELDEVLALDRR